MREIKFRAWDMFFCKMVSWDEICSLVTDEELLIKSFFDLNEDRYIPMQYTGLKDKNGKEIYEGDIVEYENRNAGYGRPRHEEINRDIVPNLTEYEDFCCGAVWWVNGEVIGNIYEKRD